jgi:hypothetical protein
MKAPSPKYLIICCWVIGAVFCGTSTADAQRDQQEPQVVDYCEIVRSPDKYIGKLVRFHAHMTYSTVPRVDGDTSFIYSPSCNDGDYHSAVEFARRSRSDNADVKKEFANLPENSFSIVAVKVVGKYDHHIIPTFGHLGWSVNQVTIHNIESARDISQLPDLDYPQRGNKQRTKFGERLRDVNAFLILILIDGSREKSILQYFAEDFIITDSHDVEYTRANFDRLLRRGLFSEPDGIVQRAVTNPRVEFKNGAYYATGLAFVMDIEKKERRLKYQNVYVPHEDFVRLVEARFTKP